MDTLRSIIPTGGPPTPKDRYTLLKEEYQRTRDELRHARATLDNYDGELRRKNGELRNANQTIDHLQHEIQRSKDSTRRLQNELNNIHQQYSEVGKKVTALNEEIFQAAATLGEDLNS